MPKVKEPVFQSGGVGKLLAHLVAFGLFFYLGHMLTSGL